MTIASFPPEADLHRRVKIAAVQAAPHFLNKQKTVEIVCKWIREAGSQGVTVVGFPETFISGYPMWFSQHTINSAEAKDLHRRLFLNAITVPGPETELMGRACRETGVFAVVGCSEKRPQTTGTIYNTQLIFGSDGRLLLKHQKYVATSGERLIYGHGTTGRDVSVPTAFGGLSALICGENSNPLATYHLSVTSPTVHVASWPSHFTGGWSLFDCTQVSTRGLAYALKCYVINSVALIDEQVILAWAAELPETAEMLRKEQSTGGKSTIINPMGQVVAGPMGLEEGLLIAEIDLEETITAKYTHDFGGHYNRPELFADLFEEYLR